MSDQVLRHEDLERTDVLPQIGLVDEDEPDVNGTAILAHMGEMPNSQHRVAPYREDAGAFGAIAHTVSGTGQLHAMPTKPLAINLEVGGIRGKIADLESKLLEAQDHKSDLDRRCEQLSQRSRESEERAVKAEATYVLQSSELYRAGQRATDAEQRLVEQRVRFEAQIVDIERQLVDARARADKRTVKLEQLLNLETERATLGERDVAGVRVEIERLRAELSTAHTAIQALEERVAKQTRAASDISRLYAQQTGQSESITAAMAENQNRIARLQAAKAESDQQVATLQEQTRVAAEIIERMQADMSAQLRQVRTLEQDIEQRDHSIDALQTKNALVERNLHDLTATKAELDSRCVELQSRLVDVQAIVAARQEEVLRLTVTVKHNETRIAELETWQQGAEQRLRDRDATIAQKTEHAEAAQKIYAQASEQEKHLRTRLDKQEHDIDSLQEQLQMRSAELETARGLVLALQRQKTELQVEKDARVAEVVQVQDVLRKTTMERDQLEQDNHVNRTQLVGAQERYDEAVQAIVVAREAIGVREQRAASLEHELRAATTRLDDANARLKRNAAAAEAFNSELHERDNRIVALERRLAEHESALSSIGQDIERVNASHPSEGLAALGYALERMDTPGVVHRFTRMTTTAGRSQSNDIPIDSTSVSRYHARLVVKPEGVWLIDLQSTNGCAVNGRRASRQILCDGDTVMIGHCKFRFSMRGAMEVDLASRLSELTSADAALSASLASPSPDTGSHLQHH